MKTGVRNFKKREINSISYVFDFGKYKDCSLADVLNDDPQYVSWLIKNDVVVFEENILHFVEDKIYRDRVDSPDWFLNVLDES